MKTNSKYDEINKKAFEKAFYNWLGKIKSPEEAQLIMGIFTTFFEQKKCPNCKEVNNICEKINFGVKEEAKITLVKCQSEKEPVVFFFGKYERLSEKSKNKIINEFSNMFEKMKDISFSENKHEDEESYQKILTEMEEDLKKNHKSVKDIFGEQKAKQLTEIIKNTDNQIENIIDNDENLKGA